MKKLAGVFLLGLAALGYAACAGEGKSKAENVFDLKKRGENRLPAPLAFFSEICYSILVRK